MSTPKSSGAVLSSKIATQTVSGETCRLLDFCCLYRINVRVYGLSYRTKPVGNGMNITRRPRLRVRTPGVDEGIFGPTQREIA